DLVVAKRSVEESALGEAMRVGQPDAVVVEVGALVVPLQGEVDGSRPDVHRSADEHPLALVARHFVLRVLRSDTEAAELRARGHADLLGVVDTTRARVDGLVAQAEPEGAEAADTADAHRIAELVVSGVLARRVGRMDGE